MSTSSFPTIGMPAPPAASVAGAGLDRQTMGPLAHSIPMLSVVTTMYKSRPFLEEFLDGCVDAVREAGYAAFEIVLVNDGSPDDSLQYALQRAAQIPEIVVVDLSRNFGHHHAIQAGLQVSRGTHVFLIDCDLEVPPSVLPAFAAALASSGADMVYGYQEVRKGGAFERIGGDIFWRGFNWLSETKVPENVLTERLMTRRFVDELLKLGDHNLFLGGMMCWTGFDQTGLPIAKSQRDGESTYTPLKRVKLMINAVSSFSAQPLLWLFNIGISITLLSFVFGIYLIGRKLIFDDALIGFTSVMAMLAMTLGIITTGLGMLGIYLGKVFTQVQGRPNFIIRRIHRSASSPAAS